MSEPAIRHERDGSKGRYVVDTPGGEAELTYSVLSPQMVIADHTGVPDAVRGKGFGELLVRRLIADASDQGFRIVPLCPYINAQRRRHPDWAELFET